MMPSWGRARSGLRSWETIRRKRSTPYLVVFTVISVMAGVAADEASATFVATRRTKRRAVNCARVRREQASFKQLRFARISAMLAPGARKFA
jgi:hypothetical protein